MKKSIIVSIAAAALFLTGCNDFLDKDPRDTFQNNLSFWNTASTVQSYCNKFYDNYAGYSQNGGFGWFYFKNISDDQASLVNGGFLDWEFTTVPNTSSYWKNGFTEVRRANYVIQNVASSTLTAAEKTKYTAIARLNRAWSYYQLVREYGDVEWINYPITDPEKDENVRGKRTDRDVVMDSVAQDLDFAISNLPTDVADKTQWSKEMAEAMKSDICLFEGTFCKYRNAADNGKAPDAARAEWYLKASQAASEFLIKSGKYKLSPNYGQIYNSANLMSDNNAKDEIIFYRNYEKDKVMHGLIDYTCSSTQMSGITKDAFDAFLFLDGKPLATTTLDTNDEAVANKDGNYSIEHILKNKDKRLSVLIDSIVCFKGHGWRRVKEDGSASKQNMTSSTGYTIRKFDNTTLEDYYRNNTNTGYTDAPLYWYAVVLLNEAEAKAELGTISQTDLDNTVNQLEKRAGLPGLTLNPEADPANNMGVSNLLWEIRRCRRCELMLDNWYRYWDLIRWHQLDKADTEKYPNTNRGANLSYVKDVESTLDANKYIVPNSKKRIYKNKYYLYPVPSSELDLNKNIDQNPLWK